MEIAERNREKRLRRMAERQELRLERSPRRDQHATDYGRYRTVEPVRNSVVAGATRRAYELTLAEVEAFLGGDR